MSYSDLPSHIREACDSIEERYAEQIKEYDRDPPPPKKRKKIKRDGNYIDGVTMAARVTHDGVFLS